MDYFQLSKELLRKIRGVKSQEYINRRLGFNSNQYSKWETGVLSMKWADFAAVCGVVKLDLKKAMSHTFAYKGDILDHAKIFDVLVSGRPTADLSRLLDRSPEQVRRWKRNPESIRLNTFLELIDKLQPSLICVFLANLLGTGNLEDFHSISLEPPIERKAAYLNPNISLIPYGLELVTYKALKTHDDVFLAEQLGITPAEVNAGILELKKLNVIQLKNGLYRNSRSNHLDLSADLEGFRTLMSFHTNQITRRLQDKINESIGLEGFFNVFNISDRGLIEINKLNREYYVKMTNLLQKHQMQDSTKVVVALSCILEARNPSFARK